MKTKGRMKGFERLCVICKGKQGKIKNHEHRKLSTDNERQRGTGVLLFHQKWRVYEHSTMDWQKDDIEYAISQYVEEMNTALYSTLSSRNNHYLLAHDSFAKDLPDAIDRLEKMMENI